MREMEEQIAYQENSGSTERRCLSPPASVSLSSSSSYSSASVSSHSFLSSSLTPPRHRCSLPPPPLPASLLPSLTLPHRAAVYERVSRVWLSLQCREGQGSCFSTKDALKDGAPGETHLPGVWICVLHALAMLRVWHEQFIMYSVGFFFFFFLNDRYPPCWWSGHNRYVRCVWWRVFVQVL